MTIKRQAQLGTVIGFIILIGLFFGFDDYLRPPFGGELIKEPIAEELTLKAPKEKILESKEIDWIETKEDGTLENKGKIIVYDYISDVEVATSTITIKDGKNDKVITENVGRRIGNAKFFENGEETIGQFYGGTPFIKQGEKWFHSETATTSIKAFEEQTKPDLISRLKAYFARSSLAVTTSYYSGAGDGVVNYSGSPGDANATHDATNGSGADYTGTEPWIEYGGGPPYPYMLGRAFLPIDTSGLPTGALVSAATLRLYLVDWGQTLIIGLVQTTQASNTTLITEDFDQCGAVDNPTEGATRLTHTGGGGSGIKTFTLNATGRGWISDSGYTKLGVRGSQDLDDSFSSNAACPIAMSEYAGTASDPYLSVTYTEAVAEPDHGSQDIIWFD